MLVCHMASGTNMFSKTLSWALVESCLIAVLSQSGSGWLLLARTYRPGPSWPRPAGWSSPWTGPRRVLRRAGWGQRRGDGQLKMQRHGSSSDRHGRDGTSSGTLLNLCEARERTREGECRPGPGPAGRGSRPIGAGERETRALRGRGGCPVARSRDAWGSGSPGRGRTTAGS